MDNKILEERMLRMKSLKDKYIDVLMAIEDPNKRISLQGRIDELTVSIKSLEVIIDKNNGIARINGIKIPDEKSVALILVKKSEKSQKKKRGRPKPKQKGVFQL